MLVVLWGLEEEEVLVGDREGGERERGRESSNSVPTHRAASMCIRVEITKSCSTSAEERIRRLHF